MQLPCSVVKASHVSSIDSWQVPQKQLGSDSDFGATPTLFKVVIGGATHSLVGVVDKNGIYYAFDHTAIRHGYVWSAKIAVIPIGRAGCISTVALREEQRDVTKKWRRRRQRGRGRGRGRQGRR